MGLGAGSMLARLARVSRLRIPKKSSKSKLASHAGMKAKRA